MAKDQAVASDDAPKKPRKAKGKRAWKMMGAGSGALPP